MRSSLNASKVSLVEAVKDDSNVELLNTLINYTAKYNTGISDLISKLKYTPCSETRNKIILGLISIEIDNHEPDECLNKFYDKYILEEIKKLLKIGFIYDYGIYYVGDEPFEFHVCNVLQETQEYFHIYPVAPFITKIESNIPFDLMCTGMGCLQYDPLYYNTTKVVFKNPFPVFNCSGGINLTFRPFLHERRVNITYQYNNPLKEKLEKYKKASYTIRIDFDGDIVSRSEKFEVDES